MSDGSVGVAVLGCTRDRPELLGDCLTSIAASMPSASELVVVAFGDRGVDAIETDLDGLGVSARLIRAERGGKSRQLNEGLRAIAHDIVVLTDDDCRVEPTWCGAMAAPFRDPNVGATFGYVEGLSGVRGVQYRSVPPGPVPSESWAYANGAAMAVRRSALLEIGGFDERLGPGAPVHGEEHDVVLRLQEAGWRVEIADAPTVHHLEWRDEEATRANLLVYSRGAGAFIGLALRRHPRRWARTAVRRARYQAHLWSHRGVEGRWFGPATTVAFARGLVHGLRLRPKRWL